MPVSLRPAIAALAPYRQGRPAAEDAFKLSSNENPFPTLPSIAAAIANASVNRYPDGTAQALRVRLAARHDVELDAVHAGAGSVSILHQLVTAAAGPGDEVIYAWRSFEAYPGIVTVAGATSVTVPVRADGSHDLDAMAEAITERTRVIIVCTPNNPTSTIVARDEFETFMARVPEEVLVILDEAYAEFVTDPAAVDGLEVRGDHENLVVLRTFSKAYGLAGLRIGYAIGAPYILDAARSTAIALSVTEAAQRGALAALDAEPELLGQVAELVSLRERIAAALANQGIRIPEPQGNFVWLATGEHTVEAGEVLMEHGIVARVFPGDGIRVSVGEPESVEKLLDATAELVRTLPQALPSTGLG
ncbi:histidinol-phosphate transaminase [uncultured Schumannella sp.]|uniref:histidinol-phosphate transaminase n=1 Tax=uncultured Schumannella sp. TaxID=1195956 RepID=UPI0025FE095F|nr:histidinol-phosphate transaminase [uncultured Schumannella sp.]